MSSPIIDKNLEERKAHRIRKGFKARGITIAKKQQFQNEARVAREATAKAIRAGKLDKALQRMKEDGIQLWDLMEYVFDPSNKQGTLRWHGFFINHGNATRILDWWTSSKNTADARQEVTEWACNHVSKLIAREAAHITKSKELQTRGQQIDGEFVTSFSFSKLHDWLSSDEVAPVSMQMLRALATSQNADKHTELRKVKTQMVTTSAALACLGEYSRSNNRVKRMISVYMYSAGAQCQLMTVISSLGLAESYSNLISKNRRRQRVTRSRTRGSQNADSAGEGTDQVTAVVGKTGTLHQLSESMRQEARNIAAEGLFATVYDNINMNFNNAEQIIGRHDTQENGTCATIVPLFDAKVEDLDLNKFQTAFLEAPVLKRDDILHTPAESRAFSKSLVFTILRIIIKFGGEGFRRFEKEMEKEQPTSEEKIEVHRSELHPLPAWNIDESTITGNAEVCEAIYDELHLGESPGAEQRVRFMSGDQLSIARLRALENIRAGHEDGEPDLVFTSLYARVLHCLLLVSGHASLEEYLLKVTSWNEFFQHAERIYDEYASPFKVEELRWDRERCKSETPTEGDMVFENALLYMCDALISREFTDAVKAGDSGRVVLVLKIWALAFRGNGRTKYAYEMLHFIHNLTNVWPKAIRDIVLKNWLLNTTGNPNSFCEFDLIQEHLNFWIKNAYKAHGANSSWEWLETMAPLCDALRKVAHNFNDMLGSDQGTRHAPPDLTDDIAALMESLDDNNVYRLKKGRVLEDGDEPVKDVIAAGLRSLEDGPKSPLYEYNEAFQKLQRRRKMHPVSALSLPSISPDPTKTTILGTPDLPDQSDLEAATPLASTHEQDVGVQKNFDLLTNLPADNSLELEVIDDEPTEADMILEDLEHGILEPTLQRLSAEDVELDMDEFPIEYNDSSSSESEAEDEE
ncbi:hypothetical protein BJ912DRAFT_1024993 [Pholiota molesta]|nr:hypothetical protein BJ912DRAFT_1024993 [Pholiota molesta]